jgi:hypothetical protein
LTFGQGLLFCAVAPAQNSKAAMWCRMKIMFFRSRTAEWPLLKRSAVEGLLAAPDSNVVFDLSHRVLDNFLEARRTCSHTVWYRAAAASPHSAIFVLGAAHVRGGPRLHARCRDARTRTHTHGRTHA